MDGRVLTTIIGLLLGGGGVAFLTTFIRGWSTIRSGAYAREREASDRLGRQLEELEDQLAVRTRDRDYWRNVAMRYSGQLVRAAIEPIPAEPVAPSERAS